MEMIQEQLILLLSVILTTIIGIVANSIRNWLNAKFSNEQLTQGKKYADIVVNATEQILQEANGKEKFDNAKVKLVEVLNANKVKISEDQIDMLIESVVAEMNKQINQENNKGRFYTDFNISTYEPKRASNYIE